MSLKVDALRCVVAMGSFGGYFACGMAAAEEMGDMPSETGMTLWELIKSGGPIMVVLGILSVLALAMIVTFFITLRSRRESWQHFIVQARSLIQEGEVDACEQLCEQKDEMLSQVLRAGLQVAGQDRYVVEQLFVVSRPSPGAGRGPPLLIDDLEAVAGVRSAPAAATDQDEDQDRGRDDTRRVSGYPGR